MKILVPKEHDSFSEVILNGENLLIRFSYNDTFDHWTFGIYEPNGTPIIAGLRIVPNFPLNLFCRSHRLGDIFFFAQTNLEHIGYSDFWEERASFLIVEAEG